MAAQKKAAAKQAQQKTESEPKALTPDEALAAATERAREWATPVKQEQAAHADKPGPDEPSE